MNFRIAVAALALTGTLAGVGTAQWLDRNASAQSATRPAFSLPDLAGEPRHVSEWDGQWLLVNFWATWCKPCREEIPLLITAQTDHGERNFSVLGLALDDREPVQDYAEKMGINYPILVDAMGVAKVQDAYGGGAALPYSVLISPAGEMVETHRGELKADELDEWLKRHLPAG